MGSILTISGVDFSANAVGYNAPVTRGLVGLFLGGTATGLKNLAPSGGVAAEVGSPAMFAAYQSNTFGNYKKLPFGDSPSMTMIWAVRVPVAPSSTPTTSWIGGSYNFSTGAGLQAVIANMTAAAAFNPTGGGAVVDKSSSIAFSAWNSWVMMAVVIDNSGQTIQVFNLSAGTAGSLTATTGTLAPNTSTTLFEGSDPQASSGSGAAQNDIAFSEYHNVALSLSELQTVYGAMKPILVGRGIALT